MKAQNVESLIEALKSDQEHIRWEAAVALGKLRGEAAVPALTSALNDRDGAVRRAAEEALAAITASEPDEPEADAPWHGFQRAPAPVYPVSKVCPNCGGTEYRQVRPARWVAFVNDRVCRACQTRYSPPTPRWAALLFLVGGLLLFLGGGFGVAMELVSFAFRRPEQVLPPCEGFGLVFTGALTAAGALSAWHGWRALFGAGKV
jgi:hypothetical protein